MAEISNRMSEIQARYENQINERVKEIESATDDAETAEEGSLFAKVKFDIKMKEQRIRLHVPSVTMRRKEMRVSLPSATMRRKTIKFDVPKIVMVDRVVGHKPEVVCRNKRNSLGISLPECRVRSKPIIAAVPETRPVRKTISFDLPEISMRTQTIVMDLPDVEMAEQTIILHLPSITVVDVEAELETAEEVARSKESEIHHLGSLMEAEMREAGRAEAREVIEAELEPLESERQSVNLAFRDPIDSLKAAASSLKRQGAPEADVAAVEKQISELVAQWADALKTIDDAIADLSAELESLAS